MSSPAKKETPTLAEAFEMAQYRKANARREYDQACLAAREADRAGDTTALAEATDDAEHWQAEMDAAQVEVEQAEAAIEFYQ